MSDAANIPLGLSGGIEITRLTKTGGPLTKRISLSANGSLNSDGSACVMSTGSAQRVRLNNLHAFAAAIGSLSANEAISLGALLPDLPDLVKVTTKRSLDNLNGHAPPDVIARTGGHIQYKPDRAALALIDIDTKGMPAATATKIRDLGGFWEALVTVMPDLAQAARVVRRSTSSGIIRTDTGTGLKGSNGVHVFVLILDGSDVERFLKTLHDRCWLRGFGWMMVGAGGQLLERSLIDRSVYAAERLVFEAAPLLESPLEQDQAQRAPVIHEGDALDTRSLCIDLSIADLARLRDLRTDEARKLAPKSRAARQAFVAHQAKRIIEQVGCAEVAAKRMVERQCNGILLPSIQLPFDAAEFSGKTVADVLADPVSFEGATLSDPLEGPAYGTCKAKIMRRPDGSPWIHSFAHGRTVYQLKHDAGSIERAMRAAPPDQAADILVQLIASADLEPDEEQSLRDLACDLAKAKARPLAARIKSARLENEKQRRQEHQDAVGAAKRDRRLRLDAPHPAAERLPIVLALDDVLADQPALEPPMRDADGRPIEPRCRTPILLHDMTETNSEESP